MTRVLATYNIKGGVGKTSAAVNLAYLAAKRGARTLLWDLDPQGASTYLFRVKPKVRGGGRKLEHKNCDDCERGVLHDSSGKFTAFRRWTRQRLRIPTSRNTGKTWGTLNPLRLRRSTGSQKQNGDANSVLHAVCGGA